jgi:hypothetical protein
MVIGFAYGVMWFITSVRVTRVLIDDQLSVEDTIGRTVCGLAGFVAGVLWPLIVVGYVFGKLARP